jgi:hypothetical protein
MRSAADSIRVRGRSALLALVVAALSSAAYGMERAGDALIASEIRHYAKEVTAVQSDLLSFIAAAPDSKRFDLYRTYNRSIGTWMQVDLLQALLERASEETSDPAEEVRVAIMEHAVYVLWELDRNLGELESVMAEKRPSPDLRLHELLRSLLTEVRVIVTRLASKP